MKKVITAFVLFSLLLTACKPAEKPIEKNETLLKYYETSEEYFDYISPFFTFRLPEYWQNKYFVDIFADHEDFYEMTSYDENGTGLIFSIYSYEDDSYKNNHENYRYLCYSEDAKKHYVIVYPDEEKYIESAKQVYSDLKESISVVLYTFKA